MLARLQKVSQPCVGDSPPAGNLDCGEFLGAEQVYNLFHGKAQELGDFERHIEPFLQLPMQRPVSVTEIISHSVSYETDSNASGREGHLLPKEGKRTPSRFRGSAGFFSFFVLPGVPYTDFHLTPNLGVKLPHGVLHTFTGCFFGLLHQFALRRFHHKFVIGHRHHTRPLRQPLV